MARDCVYLSVLAGCMYVCTYSTYLRTEKWHGRQRPASADNSLERYVLIHGCRKRGRTPFIQVTTANVPISAAAEVGDILAVADVQ